MRDSGILQAKTAVRILSGMKDESDAWPTVRCPSPAFETRKSEGKAETA